MENKILFFQVLPSIASKDFVLKNVKNIQVLYKHTENHFIITGHTNEDIKSDAEKQITFSVDRNTFIPNVLNKITSNQPHKNLNVKKIVIDFSSPNVAKPFHFGHLRSTIIGNYIANINQHFNNKVTRLNYLGDWGTQFGLLQYGLSAQNVDVNKLKNNPMKTLYDAYVYANKLAKTDNTVQQEARKYFTQIESGQTNLENWRQIRETTVNELGNVYRRLGIEFDEYHWESEYNGGAIRDLMQSLEEKGIINTDSDGKKVTKVNDRTITVLKSDNSTLYLSRDIAALLDRYKKFEFDKMLYIVDNAQTDHFSTLFEVVRQIDRKCADVCEHIKFGRIKGMSTRAGNVVFLNDILDEAKQKMAEKQSQSKSN